MEKKKIIVVSKTHLDLGFTDYAKVIEKRYVNEFIPRSIRIADELNKGDKKQFVWTVGSWLIKTALEKSSDEDRQKLLRAIENGDITYHALPLTLHTELLDEDTFRYGLDIAKRLDERFGRKTIAAKMTDVPGHTKAIVPLLASYGIKLLHIGVNGASRVPDVPSVFRYKCGGDEIVVIYEKSYGGEHKNQYIDDILYVDHSQDNQGPKSSADVMKTFNRLKEQYPDYEVVAGTLDDYAKLLLEKKDELPVIDSEIGDSWIHGAATDPYKASAIKLLQEAKRELLEKGESRESERYLSLSDAILKLCEHTCGVDVKRYFGDYENYLQKDFEAARAADKVVVKKPFINFPYAFFDAKERKRGEYNEGSYKAIEKSWAEQRGYIEEGVSALTENMQKSVREKLNAQMPKAAMQIGGEELAFDKFYNVGQYEISLNKLGGITLKRGEDFLLEACGRPLVDYRTYSAKDYAFWKEHYTRDYKETRFWCRGDFLRPGLKHFDDKYFHGRESYFVKSAHIDCLSEPTILMDMEIGRNLADENGAPRRIQAKITVGSAVKFELVWLDKKPSRLTSAVFLRFYPTLIDNSALSVWKIGSKINPYDVVSGGDRKLCGVEKVEFSANDRICEITPKTSFLFSLGEGKILEYDNEYESAKKDGISFVLYDNVWGTNFPLWYGDNARFEFDLDVK